MIGLVNEKSDYEVGYARPPSKKRWLPGQSGNIAGRPAGSCNTLTMLNKLANEEIKINQNGKQNKISKKGAALLQAVNKAAAGDGKALKTLLPHLMAADSKVEGLLDLINFKSPKIDRIINWLIEVFEECLMESPGVDKMLRTHIFALMLQKIDNFPEVASRILNNPNWTPENSPPNPFLEYDKTKNK